MAATPRPPALTPLQPVYGAEGYDAVAADNYDQRNDERACGVWRGSSWVQLYSGVEQDAVYEAAMLAWLAAFRAALHALDPPLLLVPNFSVGALPHDSPSALAVLNGVDGALDERGFTGWGAGFVSGAEFANVRGWARALQAAGLGARTSSSTSGGSSSRPRGASLARSDRAARARRWASARRRRPSRPAPCSSSSSPAGSL